MAQTVTRVAALGGCLLATVLAVGGCGRGPLNSPSTGSGCSLTVSLPVRAGLPVAGAMARVGGRSTLLDRPTSTLLIPCGLTARLGPAARRPGSPPPTGWTVDGQIRRGHRISVLIDGLVTAALDVRLPAPSPSGAVLPRATPPGRSPSPRPTPRASPPPSAAAVTVDRWLAYDAASRTATLLLVAGAAGVNYGFNFDGEAFGRLRVTVPAGWRVIVHFRNIGTFAHSAAVVTARGTTPAFPGATVPDPIKGLPPGSQDTFRFVAGTPGSYRIACLFPGHEELGMWAAFGVTPAGVPTIHL